MAKNRSAKRRSIGSTDFTKIDSRAIPTYLDYHLKGVSDPYEKIKVLNKANINIEVNSMETLSMQQVATAVMISTYARLEVILAKIVPERIKEYMVYLVQNSAEEIPEWGSYKPLSKYTMRRANKPHDMYFYEWTGDLIENGIEVMYTPGVYSRNINTGSFNVDSSPEVEIRAGNGTHEPSGLDYSTIFKFLEYGTHSKDGKLRIPPRPFFDVVAPKVEAYVEEVLQELLES